MTDQRKPPASLRRQAEGNTGGQSYRESVPAWARKRVQAALVRFQGQYHTPETFAAQIAGEAAEYRGRGCRGQAPYGDASPAPVADQPAGTPGLPGDGERPTRHPADALPSRYEIDTGTGEVLPCRFLETTQSKVPKGLTGPHKKTASALSWNVAHLCKQYGIHRVGFLTLTFADHVLDAREAQRRFNSLATNVLRHRYADYIRVLERQKSGRIHYHLLVVAPEDIRTGADFDAFARRDYQSANNHLRREWAYWRHTAPLYRFGRTELLPIRSDAAALGQYVGKYIGKHIGQRDEQDKGVRLVAYTRGARMATSRHTVVSSHANDQWRGKVQTFARQVEAWKRKGNPHVTIRDADDLAFYLGKKWAYHWRDYIFSLPPADLSVPF